MQVARDLAVRVPVVGKDNPVHAAFVVLVQPRLMESGTQREALKDTRFTGQFACLENSAVDLHRLAILATIRATGDEHLLHQHLISEQFVEKAFFYLALLCKLGQPARCGVSEDRRLDQFGVQRFAAEGLADICQDRSGRQQCVRLRFGLHLVVFGLGCGVGEFFGSLDARKCGTGFEKGGLLPLVDGRQGGGDIRTQRFQHPAVLREKLFTPGGQRNFRIFSCFGHLGNTHQACPYHAHQGGRCSCSHSFFQPCSP